MIQFQKHLLANGLTVLVHEDFSTPLASVNIVYNTGSRNDEPNRTGFAHLFEHLMFGGSANVEDFDTHIQMAGGDANAFTNNDITNYYEILPAANVETALWLESDRMANLTLDKENLENEKKVVVEEFKETCVNQPYGDVWHHLSALCYKEHPYRWPVIGLDFSHVSNAKISDVKRFFKRWYQPSNAILVIAGAVKADDGFRMAEKWFGDIKSGPRPTPVFPVEPEQTSRRELRVNSNVPANALYMAFPMPGRMHEAYYAADLLSDLLGNGRSCRLYQSLVRQKKLFNDIDAYITGTIDAGMFIVEGRLMPEVSYEQAEQEVRAMLDESMTVTLAEREYTKLINRAISGLHFAEMGIQNKASGLAGFELLGDAAMINQEADRFRSVSSADINRIAAEIFQPQRASVLYYGK